MQKGIVMEKHRDYIIVMRRDGAFQKAQPLENSVVGTEVSYQPLAGKKHPVLHYINKKKAGMFQIAVIACILLLMMPVYFMMDRDKTYAYVNISINPNMELEIDDHLNVKSVVSLNEDAKAFEGRFNEYEGNQLVDVIEKIMSESEKKNLLQNGKNMLAGVSYIEDKHQISVIDAIEDYFLENGQEWKVVTMQIPEEIREQAQGKTESMNQLMAISLVESEFSTGTNGNNAVAETSMDDDDREILHSFYNDINDHSGTAADKTQPVKTDREVSSEEKASDKTDQTNQPAEEQDNKKSSHPQGVKHPGELKPENAERSGYGKNKGNKTIHSDNNGKAKGHGKAKQNNGKAKGDHKAKENNDKANGHNKANHSNGNSKGHHKGNNGNNNAGNNGKGPK